jgi:hypothetical protein
MSSTSYELSRPGIDQPQNTGLGHQSWTISNRYAASPVCQSKDETHARPSFGDTAPVRVLHALPTYRKKTAMILTKQEQTKWVWTCWQKTTARRGNSCESNTLTKANDSTDCMAYKMKYYNTKRAQVDWLSAMSATCGFTKLALISQIW